MIEAHLFYIVTSLNRTFYGIETFFVIVRSLRETVLIVPFMELKLRCRGHDGAPVRGLNRTFYGIETS